MRTSEGEDLVVCTARYDVEDLDGVWRRLGQDLEDTGDGMLTELAEVRGQGAVIRGTIRITGRRLVVETNAIERLRRLQDRVLTADPAARLVDESTVPMERMLAERAEAPGPEGEPSAGASIGSGLSPEQEQEALAEAVRRHEETWPDIELPALSGRTPRQAATDPALRPELAALLDDFDWQIRRQGAGVGMDVDRLRRVLGLGTPER